MLPPTLSPHHLPLIGEADHPVRGVQRGYPAADLPGGLHNREQHVHGLQPAQRQPQLMGGMRTGRRSCADAHVCCVDVEKQ